MKLKSILAVLAISAVLFSCEPGYDEDNVIKNNSGLEVTVISPNINVTIPDGTEKTIGGDGGVGGANRERCEWTMNRLLGDRVVFQFNDGSISVVFHKNDTTGLSPYNFKSSAYSYEDKTAKFPKGDPNSPCYGKLTYTISPDIIPADAD